MSKCVHPGCQQDGSFSVTSAPDELRCLKHHHQTMDSDPQWVRDPSAMYKWVRLR